MSTIKSALTQIILTILQNTEVQKLNAKKIAILSKALFAIEKFPKIISWDNPLRVYIKNKIGKDNLWRRISFEVDNITLGNEESLNGPFGHDGRWTLIFEHFSKTELDITDEDQNNVAEWCHLTCAEISSVINNVEIDYYDDLGWDVFDSIDDTENDDFDEFKDDEDNQDEDNQDEYDVANSNERVEYNYELVEQVLRKKYSRYIDGFNIHIHGAYFTVDLVVKTSLSDIKNNPNLKLEDIIDKWIAYFQT